MCLDLQQTETDTAQSACTFNLKQFCKCLDLQQTKTDTAQNAWTFNLKQISAWISSKLTQTQHGVYHCMHL